ncbi:conserved hypothetical protein [uncultured delta proteobacterium]|uniref:Restriction alleviation protein, Lar family n=1 Tax=uncultured delta proteobacterium TaxID=34034 RepID=A0A212J2W3_9DELT|nr:conserved hypothetical protein [uncultured delta proteobacterium]
MAKENFPISIRPCIKCGKIAVKIETTRPLGRTQDLYRVVCECGNGPTRWSVSEGAAIRLWNSHDAR